MNKPQNHTPRIGLVLSLAPGYSETFFRSKITGLLDDGNAVVLFCSENDQNFELCPVFLLPKPQRNVFKQLGLLFWVYVGLLPYLKSVFRFIRMERRDNIDWVSILKRVYTHSPIFKQELNWLHFGFGTLALDCENLAGAIKAKMAVSFRGFDIGVYPIKHPNCYKKLWSKVTKIHVISDDIEHLLYKNGFNNQAAVVKITPAIDIQYFSTLNKILIESPVQLITVARLHWKKGLDYALEALAQLKSKGVSFEYRIIGKGPEEEALKFACNQLGLQQNVFFLGRLEHAEVKAQLAKSHIYIQYSVQEGFCNAVLEAQAMGLFCVVSDAEGLAENVINEVTGFVVNKRKPKELANTIERLLHLPSDQKKLMIATAIKRVNHNFNLEKQKNEYADFYSNNNI